MAVRSAEAVRDVLRDLRGGDAGGGIVGRQVQRGGTDLRHGAVDGNVQRLGRGADQPGAGRGRGLGYGLGHGQRQGGAGGGGL
ncbi:hypothetical protein D6Z83_16455, partial [Pseudoroseomonas wenyumeiae]